jgi:hypothetical protein
MFCVHYNTTEGDPPHAGGAEYNVQTQIRCRLDPDHLAALLDIPIVPLGLLWLTSSTMI